MHSLGLPTPLPVRSYSVQVRSVQTEPDTIVVWLKKKARCMVAEPGPAWLTLPSLKPWRAHVRMRSLG